SETPETSKKNRLASESSPYLLQHADNPVDWHPWGDEAFEKARREDKPIFLSIGYATCHWCHVMEHESFEDPAVAALMNDTFVNIKVDREERPDIDQVYMTVCQMLTGSGGWPLTIIMTPDKEPFFAGTYFPRESRLGRIGMTELVPKVQALWSDERDKVTGSADQITARLGMVSQTRSPGAVDPKLPDRAVRELTNRFDDHHGGFGSAPKFPSPHNLLLLSRYAEVEGEPRGTVMVDETLRRMHRGGVYDQVGYGFHRYSTDARWLVPHFEKMLYDQATMVLAATEASAAAGDARHRRLVDEVLTYVRRDMTAPGGGFYSAEDADSEGEEGTFYLWTRAQLAEVLGEVDAAFAAGIWNVVDGGNFAEESTGEKTGANILHLAGDGTIDAERLEAVRSALFAAREHRVHPLKDDKVLADWNGLMAAAFARAGTIFGDPVSIAAAEASVGFVLREMRDGDGRLLHRWREGDASVPAFLDDHAFLTWAALELYDATFDPAHLELAIELQSTTDSLFRDTDNGGYFFTAADNETLLVRQKEVYDGAIPSGNSVAARNLLRLARLTGREELATRADEIFAAFAADTDRAASGHSHLADAVLFARSSSMEIVIAGEPGSDDTEALLGEVRKRYLPTAVTLVVPPGPEGDRIRTLAPFTENHVPIDGRAAAYVCRNHACKLPTTDPAELGRLLDEAARGSGG
ncbi:MAG: thioredoxin domain-containing protein, partial [Thermoanaerobaculales bacterium]|nr:thioredoxin domain-containing protein [Thermoanaerobaculales bacterium]